MRRTTYTNQVLDSISAIQLGDIPADLVIHFRYLPIYLLGVVAVGAET